MIIMTPAASTLITVTVAISDSSSVMSACAALVVSTCTIVAALVVSMCTIVVVDARISVVEPINQL